MRVFRIISILCSIGFIVLLILSKIIEFSALMSGITFALGIIVAILNIIAVILWWIVDDSNQYNADQLRLNRLLGG